MPKTSEDRVLIQKGYKWSAIFHKGMGYRLCEDEDDLRALAMTMRDIFKDKLKKAEKMIDKIGDYSGARTRNEAKQILHDCFGVGK